MPHFDLTIDGTSAMIVRGEGTFKERSIRTEITQNLLSQSQELGLVSRPDQPRLYQTDWSGGSRWWKPIAQGEDLKSYFSSNNFDLWSEPGKINPRNTSLTIGISAAVNDDAPVAASLGGELYVVAGDDTVDASHWDVGKWTPASNAFVTEAGVHSGVNDTSFPVAAVGDPSDGYVYLITEDGELVRFNPVTDAVNGGWITGLSVYPGANIFLHNGFLMFYSGDQIYTVTKATPTTTSVFNDGMGKDFMDDATFSVSTSDFFFATQAYITLAVATPEGIYYVKNTRQGGQPQAWIFRVDLDEAGNWIGNPLGVLPAGNVALSVAYHLGSLMISATPDWIGALRGEEPDIEIVLYHLTDGSLGSLGSVLGRSQISKTDYRFLGSEGPLLYLGNLWVYDAVRGGIFQIRGGSTNYLFMASVEDSAGVSCQLFQRRDSADLFKVEQNNNPDTVTNFGDDETFYTLESNYFDMGLPMETKEITRVALSVDAGTTAQEWTLQLSTDDSAFADVLAHSTATQYNEATVSAGTHRGRLFRYKLIYQTKNAVKRALRAVLITANAGEMVREWDLMLDGSSLLNVNNITVRPAVFAEALRATGAKEQAITVVFNYQDEDATADTGETVTCKVQLVEIIKDKPDEAMIHVILREA